MKEGASDKAEQPAASSPKFHLEPAYPLWEGVQTLMGMAWGQVQNTGPREPTRRVGVPDISLSWVLVSSA